MTLFTIIFVSLMSIVFVLEFRLLNKRWKEVSALILLLTLAGCTAYKHTVIKASGDNMRIPLAGIVSAKGDNVELELNRTVCIGKCNVKLH